MSVWHKAETKSAMKFMHLIKTMHLRCMQIVHSSSLSLSLSRCECWLPLELTSIQRASELRFVVCAIFVHTLMHTSHERASGREKWNVNCGCTLMCLLRVESKHTMRENKTKIFFFILSVCWRRDSSRETRCGWENEARSENKKCKFYVQTTIKTEVNEELEWRILVLLRC
jgi:hypothetical protein